GERDAERHRCRVAGTRVAIGDDGHGDAGVEKPARIQVSLPRGELRGRQRRRDGAAGGEGVDVGIAQKGAVVDARCLKFYGELHATGDGELTGVQASTQALRPTRGEDGPGLVDVERSTLAERIDPARVRGARGEHGPR